jgi:hypothetical protein
MYDIEITRTIVLFFEMSLYLNVLSANMLIIVVNVLMSFINSTKMRNVSNSLLISMTNLSFEIFSCETSSMISSLKYWAINSSISLSLYSTINCLKRRLNFERSLYARLQLRKRFFDLSRFCSIWFVDQHADLSHTKHILDARIENLSRERKLDENRSLSQLLKCSRQY